MGRDGEIRIAGATELLPGVAQPDLERRQAALTKWIREVRGGVLSGAFFLEQNIDLTILQHTLGATADEERKTFFREHFLSRVSFDRRIQIVSAIVSDSSLAARLNKVRRIRNAMAHQPCWFELSDGANQSSLTTHILIDKVAVNVDDKVVEGWNELMAGLLRDTRPQDLTE